MPESQTPVLLTIQDRVATLTLNRGAQRNSLSMAMMGAMLEALTEAGQTEAARVLVVRAAGPAFCAGHDLKELTQARQDTDGGVEFFTRTFSLCAELMMAVVQHPLPVVAAVQGIATAAGCQLVASCDLALASVSARFATPGVDIGLFCSTPSVALTRAIPHKAAAAMLFTGEAIDARQAEHIGLINRAVGAESLLSEVSDLARTIASKPRATVVQGKAALLRQRGLPLREAYFEAARAMVSGMTHTESGEGIGAFLEKRAPRWT